MFDGSQWNRLLGADGQTCPQVRLSDEAGQYSLANDKNAKIEKLETAPELIRFQTVGKPRATSGKPSPWTVKLSYEVYPEGALFIDVDYTLDKGNTVLTGSSMSLLVDRAVTKAAKYRHVFQLLGPEGPKVFPSARVAFGVNPQRSFTNEIEAIVEYRTPMGGTTAFDKGVGRSTWTLAGGKTRSPCPLSLPQPVQHGLGLRRDGDGKTRRLISLPGAVTTGSARKSLGRTARDVPTPSISLPPTTKSIGWSPRARPLSSCSAGSRGANTTAFRTISTPRGTKRT